MRPWLVEICPLVIPSAAREELGAIAVGLSTEEFVDKVWIKRDQAYGPVTASHREDWPMKRPVAGETNVTQLPVKAKARK